MSLELMGANRLDPEMNRGGKESNCPDDAEQAGTIRRLRAVLDRFDRRRARRAGWSMRFVPTGLAALDEALPHGGLPCGAVTEILSDGPGGGAMTLAMRIAARCLAQTDANLATDPAARDARVIVVADTRNDFYPPAVRSCGVSVDRLIVLSVRHTETALWAVEQSLGCLAVAAVVAPLDRINEPASRRLQLAARGSGGIGLILRSADRRRKSFAAIRMLIQSVSNTALVASHDLPDRERRCVAPARTEITDSFLCRITLLGATQGACPKPLALDLNHETGALPVHPILDDRSIAQTG